MFTLQEMRGNVELITEKIRQEAIEEVLEKFKEADRKYYQTCRDKATLNPDFKPEFIPGGFAAHCTNQSEQSYTYEPDEKGEVTTFHWSDKFQRYGQPGNLTLSKGRHEFYDYNF